MRYGAAKSRPRPALRHRKVEGDPEEIELGFFSETAIASYGLGAWTLHLTGGYQFEEERTIALGEALVLPGRYSNSGGIVLLGVAHQR